MTKNSTFIQTILVLLIIMTGCDRPVCKNANPIFDKFSPDAKEYKSELVKQLATVDKSKLTYWIDAYKEDYNSKYILTNVQGDGLCAKIFLSVKDSKKGIEDVIEKKGVSYIGVELEELKFDIKQDSTAFDFVFQEISRIVD